MGFELDSIEVSGKSIDVVLTAFGAHRALARKYLAKHGLLGLADKIDLQRWFSIRPWLAMFADVEREIGPATMTRIGINVMRHMPLPPTMHDVDSAISLLDAGYHMNHRKHGEVMFDPKTNSLLEGIGHYGYQRMSGKNAILSVCENPYPCSFDRGVLEGVATAFEPNARITHATGGCRQKGAASCSFVVSW